MHEKWGGVVPDIAMRAHKERIDDVIDEALNKAKVSMEDIYVVAVTYGPGLAIALGVGIDKAKELAHKHDKKLIAVNHMEGHIYSCFAQNSKGNPDIPFEFPYLVLLVSGSHTQLMVMKNHGSYQLLGETQDDAAGEALDKGARIIVGDMVYPGGPVIERLAQDGDPEWVRFPRPMERSQDYNFSFSGLKTALLYKHRALSEEERVNHMCDLAASYQQAVIDSLLYKVRSAVNKLKIRNVVVGGGVSINEELRKTLRTYMKSVDGEVLFPSQKELNGDNAAMIGVAAFYKAERGEFSEPELVEREARAKLMRSERIEA